MSEKVVLPRGISRALDSVFGAKSDREVSATIFNIIHCSSHDLVENAAIVKDYFEGHGLILLFQCLANGYDAEKTPEEELLEYYKKATNVQHVITTTLNILDVKIIGINA